MVTEFIIAASLMVAAAFSQQAATRVVLLPNEDGHASTLTVTTGKETVQVDQAYQVVEISDDLKTQVKVTDAQAVAEAFGEVLKVTPPREQRYVLYFKPGGTDLTDASTSTLNELLQQVRLRTGGELVVVGHTDRQGDADKNDALSIKRAQALRQRISEEGFDLERIQAYGRGEREPLVATEDGVAEAKNRRAEVIVR